jgi:moderate conductance mechanosensitive channel
MGPLLATLILAQTADTGMAAACGDTPGLVCRLVYDATGKETLARAVEWVVAKPLKVLLVITVAWLLVTLLRRGIRRFVERLVAQREEQAARRREEAEAPSPDGQGRRAARARQAAEQAERGRQRAQALGTVLRSLVSVVIWSLAALVVLGEFGVNLGPLIAGAGIAGIALGFGAQTLVRDFLSGVFMLAEDQYGVGDVVDLGDAQGTVEEIRLRTTRLRDGDGTVWYVPNGEVRRVANKSQRWARAILDFEVAADTDLDRATRAMKEAADALWQEAQAEATILEEPEVLGVEALGDGSVVLRVALKVDPGEQWAVARLARRRIKEALDAAGIAAPMPQQVVWLRAQAGPTTN